MKTEHLRVPCTVQIAGANAVRPFDAAILISASWPPARGATLSNQAETGGWVPLCDGRLTISDGLRRACADWVSAEKYPDGVGEIEIEVSIPGAARAHWMQLDVAVLGGNIVVMTNDLSEAVLEAALAWSEPQTTEQGS